MEDIKNKLKAVIGDKNVQIIDSETGKELSLDELVNKLSSDTSSNEVNYDMLRLDQIKRNAGDVRKTMERLPKTRETALAITKLDECMLWLKAFEMSGEIKKTNK